MEEQTITLLKECNSGCRMAINSMDRLKDFVINADLNKVMETYKAQHKELEEESLKLLMKYSKSPSRAGETSRRKWR